MTNGSERIGPLVVIKLLNTVIWAILVGGIVALPMAALLRWFNAVRSCGAATDKGEALRGHVLGGGASTRPRMVGKSLVETPWSGTGEYRMFDRIQVPTVAEAMWHLREGQFTCWRGRIIDFRVLR